ncbi:hypothetical protein ACFY00_37370 [Kitasatospora sp. NPDC001540]|uniref:hypothetical protein n=1 Tax=Kitasatospora sp. NPDC001540 TaxID=3364014 RepID=UPI0036A90201
MDLISAVHEAAHAVAVLAGRGRLHHVQLSTLSPDPVVDGSSGTTHWDAPLPTDEAFAAVLGAGERAADRWLREARLWTPERAVAVETGVWADRTALLDSASPCMLGFGEGAVDYFAVHDLADTLLEPHWPAVTTLADHLVRHRYLAGHQIADITSLPNR